MCGPCAPSTRAGRSCVCSFLACAFWGPSFRAALSESSAPGRGPFATGDVRSPACRGNDFETGAVIKVGYREESWSLNRPTAPYQVRQAADARSRSQD